MRSQSSRPCRTSLRTSNRSSRRLPDDTGNDKLIPAYRQLRRSVRQADLESPAELLAVLEPFTECKAARGRAKDLAGRQNASGRRARILDPIRGELRAGLRSDAEARTLLPS